MNWRKVNDCIYNLTIMCGFFFVDSFQFSKRSYFFSSSTLSCDWLNLWQVLCLSSWPPRRPRKVTEGDLHRDFFDPSPQHIKVKTTSQQPWPLLSQQRNSLGLQVNQQPWLSLTPRRHDLCGFLRLLRPFYQVSVGSSFWVVTIKCF